MYDPVTALGNAIEGITASLEQSGAFIFCEHGWENKAAIFGELAS